jgi:hypothetical protein
MLGASAPGLFFGARASARTKEGQLAGPALLGWCPGYQS